MHGEVMLALFFVLAVSVNHISGHASMVKPINWLDSPNWFFKDGGWTLDYLGMKSGAQCLPGCTLKPTDVCQPEKKCEGYPNPGCSCWWYKNYTFVEKPTIFDPNLLTYPHVKHPERHLHYPWRAPGYAPVDSPCGVAGGNFNGCIGGKCAFYKGGAGYGLKAQDVKVHYWSIKTTEWQRGADEEVAWGILANHGGGYSYRLCKIPSEGVRGLTEECFQKAPLQFVGNTQWVQFGEDTSTRFEFPAVRTDRGTFPKGSQWTKNPIPACNGDLGGFSLHTAKCPNGTQFPPPREDLAGFGVSMFGSVKPFQFSIMDKVHVPEELEPGNYVLSFRWDTEQTPQVWNTCASILIK